MKKAIYAVLVISLMALSYSVGKRHTSVHATASTDNVRRVLYYVDPMHPSYKSDKPGIAPDCGMKLEPVYADDSSASGSASAGAVHIDAEKQQLIGVRVAPVEKSSGVRELRLSGRVASDETRVYRLTSGVEGWVEETFSDSVGTQVKKGQNLAAYYSREMWAAQQSYLAGTYGTTPNKDAGQATQAVIDRLRTLGVSQEKIDELSRMRKPSTTSYFSSPVDGFILSRNISPGQKFDPGVEFYRIVDLSHVWILADVFENDTQTYRPGMNVTVALPQGKKLQARVSDVLPQIDPVTRTFKLRLEADNPGYILRPDMFVDVVMSVRLPAGLNIPADAVIDSGLRKRVYVESGPGIFEPREVETGWRLGDRVQVVSGLKEGEHVVSAGTFLVDSESKLEASASGHATVIPAAAQPQMHNAPEQKGTELKRVNTPGATHDPACGMEIDPAKAKTQGNTFDHMGKTYYFCSRQCKEKFEKNPEKYMGGSAEMAGARP